MHNLSLQSEVFTRKSVLHCSKTSLCGMKNVTRALFEQIMTFQQEVTIMSRDTPSKVVISPLLLLNGLAIVVEKFSFEG